VDQQLPADCDGAREGCATHGPRAAPLHSPSPTTLHPQSPTGGPERPAH